MVLVIIIVIRNILIIITVFAILFPPPNMKRHPLCKAAQDTEQQPALLLLQVADPDGYFKSGSRAAEVAKARAQKAMQLEKQQREAQERRRKEKLVSIPRTFCLDDSVNMTFN